MSRAVPLQTAMGMADSEFEDYLDPATYEGAVAQELGVDLTSPRFRGNQKWSNRVRATLQDQGKVADAAMLARVKSITAAPVAHNPNAALHPNKRNSIDALVTTLEGMLKLQLDAL